MPQNAVLRPVAVSHFGDQFGFDPMHSTITPARGRVAERRLGLNQGLQAPLKIFKGSFVESGSDPPGINQFFSFIISNEQSAKGTARSRGIGPAADHKFLALIAFDFDPVAAAACMIGPVETLGDHPLQRVAAGLLEKFLAVPGEVIAITDRAR